MLAPGAPGKRFGAPDVARCAFGLVLLGLGLAPGARAEGLTPATFIPVLGSVVRVEAIRQAGGLAVGTAVTVAPSVVVTNCHVTRDATTISISGRGQRWRVDAQVADLARDVCYLRAPAWPGTPVALVQAGTLRLGQSVAAVGYNGGASVSLKIGHVRALHVLDDAHVIESDTAFNSGSSGGGLFDESGALVGLLTFRLRGSSQNYYSVPVDWIRQGLPESGRWAAVGPLEGSSPFWAGDAEKLPYFMRAAPLAAAGRWNDLLELADRWSVAQPGDAEALLVRGKALQNLNRPEAAARAYHRASDLAPEDPAAWYGLAFAYASAGDDPARRTAEARLQALDRGLAAELETQIENLQSGR